MTSELNCLVGGEAGQGIQTIGFVLAKSFARGGLAVFADQDYESRVRGGHNFYRVRTAGQNIAAQTEDLDLIVALDAATLKIHRQALKPGGRMIADLETLKLSENDQAVLNVPLERLAIESAGNRIMANSVAVGAVLGLLHFPFEVLAATLEWHFSKADVEIRKNNVAAAQAGYQYMQQHRPAGFNPELPAASAGGQNLINGNEAIALGALAAGCRFAAIYPMTPITSILEYLADKGRKYGTAVIQPEDEIAAINMVLGASYAGVRAMTATSGSGFALMVEGLGLAGMTETPVVIVLGQRPGPAIGLPTRTEQGELLFAVNSGTGEFPRVVLAPSDAEEAFYLTARAFNLAEQFQVPVILITDTHLANSYHTGPKFDLSRIKIERGEWAAGDNPGEYRRYQLTESGISPRLIPGSSPQVVAADSDEHDENGHPTESAQVRAAQTDKRMNKYQLISRALALPRFEQTVNARLTLIGWGSTAGAIREASAILTARGIANNVLHYSEIWPFPAEYTTAALKAAPVNIVIENNYTGQLATLIRTATGLNISGRVNKWDGRPISAQDILNDLKKGGFIDAD